MLKPLLKTIRNCTVDCLRYLRHSGTVTGGADRDVLRAQIMMDTHRIEKGMALPTPRPSFGKDVLARLVVAIRQYESRGGPDYATEWSRGVLRCYCDFNAHLGTPSDAVESFLDVDTSIKPLGGIIEIYPPANVEEQSAAFERLAMTRHSVRQFAPGAVDPALIWKAVAIAAKAPSVCNRQSGRLHHVTDPEKKRCALEIQGGNGGFGESIPDLLIATSDLSNFLTSAERYQPWIDGGLFAMSTVYALHSLGLGTCMLNWSVDVSRDAALRRVVEIPKSENVICFIAVGHMPEKLTVAASPRYPTEQFITQIA